MHSIPTQLPAFAPATPILRSTSYSSTFTSRTTSHTRTYPARRHRTWICQHHGPSTTDTPSSTSSTPPPPPEDPHGRSSDYYTNVGALIDTLRHDYPHLLDHEPDLTYFRRDIMFSDGAGGRVSGIEAYRALLWVLRAQTRFVFADAVMEIQSMFHDDRAGEFYIRWRFSAAPRAWVNAARAAASPTVLDGMSIYRFDNHGKVAEHRLESLVKRRGGAGVKVMFEEVLAMGTVRVKGKKRQVPVGGVPTWFKTVLEHEEGELEWENLEENEDSVTEESCENEPMIGLMS